ncbi:hypothetical protein ALI144C_48225 [Actinosynnema sp. ALI-1.44]|uniref:hypothetical protein n=1 Tax=Actinosynnema sp. ALI-1.44 TaxID=1933779 RepID=UPI00097BEDE6|nr:hypothetical protein [Actinosynnema sp. ALI-1.44]ONI70445.1 hypothetical protein ALI144C_48225 [Actinosynnema sp. ALI-1.44]
MSAPGGGYKGLGYYDEKPQAKKPTGLIVAVVVAAVVVVGLIAALVIVKPTSAVNGEALAVANPTTPSTDKSGASNNPLQPKPTGKPKVDGWKVIAVNNGKELKTSKGYDVPPAWEPLTSSAVFGEGANALSLFTPGIFQKGFCQGVPNSFRAIAGLLTVPNEGDNATQSKAAAQRVGEAVYTTKAGLKPQFTFGEPKPVTIDGNKKSYVVTATMTITPGPEDKCPGTAAAVSVVVIEAKPEDKTSIVIAATGDQGVPDAVPATDFEKIVTSLHPVN